MYLFVPLQKLPNYPQGERSSRQFFIFDQKTLLSQKKNSKFPNFDAGFGISAPKNPRAGEIIVKFPKKHPRDNFVTFSPLNFN